MRRRGRPLVALDQADLVLVAAEVLAEDPDDLVATADVAVLCGIASRLPTIPDLARATAEVLVGVAAGRPFGRDDAAVAWLAAVVLVERNGHTIEVDDDQWVALVRDAADGTRAEREVADALAPALHRRRSRVRRMLAAACEPRACPVPSTYPCPTCGADVDRSAIWLFPVCAVPTAAELTAACARRRGSHDRHGTPRPDRAGRRATRWCPVVLSEPDDAGIAGFVALTDGGPRAFRPALDGTAYDVVAIDELTPSDLVGSRSRLRDRGRGRLIGRVPAAVCRLDGASRVDWLRVTDALDALDAESLVPA